MGEVAGHRDAAGRCADGDGDPTAPAVSPSADDGAAPPPGVPWADPLRDRATMDPARRAEVLLGLCRTADQLQDIAGMVATEQYCADVLDELRRAHDALDAIAAVVTRNYLEQCVPLAIQHDDPFIYDELMRVLDAEPESARDRPRSE